MFNTLYCRPKCFKDAGGLPGVDSSLPHFYPRIVSSWEFPIHATGTHPFIIALICDAMTHSFRAVGRDDIKLGLAGFKRQ